MAERRPSRSNPAARRASEDRRRLEPSGWGPHELRDYALVADGRRGALIGPAGSVQWLCFPHWDDEAVFSDLIGGLGRYTVTPYGRWVWGGYYEDGSLIWRNRWVTTEGIIECRDCLVQPSRPDTAVIARRITGVAGSGRVGATLQPRAGFGEHPFRVVHRDEDGNWIGRTGDLWIRWSGAPAAVDLPDGHRGRELLWTADIARGAVCDLLLEISERNFDGPAPDPRVAWDHTSDWWGSNAPTLEGVVARRDVRHSYCVLQGLTAPGGGTVAAATTSLPERAREGRSYDYRYVWLRDQAFIGQAAAAGGGLGLLDDAVSFLTARLLDDGPGTAPAYTHEGTPVPDQRSLDLPGYPGGTDLVGNQVRSQFQLDMFGEALLLFADAARLNRLDGEGWKAAQVAADTIERRWNEPDAGIWELEPRWWAHSRLICSAGLRAMAGAGAPRPSVGPWSALADRLLAEVASRSVHRSGRWQRAPEDERVDAALLLASVRGAVPADDARSVATLEAVLTELTDDGYAYRYRPDQRPLGEAEGAFLLCGFLVSMAQLQAGRPVEAARWFERNRCACGPPRLLAEEFDVVESQLRGNLPQAFVHSMMIESAFRLTHGG
ncbi:MAG TPA: glycoside hydrolase family 15 protein [Acidimicrobiales bacterium]|nr:glycoside hydrolase family 15 protein [Acidimicrobiales bacterium]